MNGNPMLPAGDNDYDSDVDLDIDVGLHDTSKDRCGAQDNAGLDNNSPIDNSQNGGGAPASMPVATDFSAAVALPSEQPHDAHSNSTSNNSNNVGQLPNAGAPMLQPQLTPLTSGTLADVATSVSSSSATSTTASSAIARTTLGLPPSVSHDAASIAPTPATAHSLLFSGAPISHPATTTVTITTTAMAGKKRPEPTGGKAPMGRSNGDGGLPITSSVPIMGYSDQAAAAVATAAMTINGGTVLSPSPINNLAPGVASSNSGGVGAFPTPDGTRGIMPPESMELTLNGDEEEDMAIDVVDNTPIPGSGVAGVGAGGGAGVGDHAERVEGGGITDGVEGGVAEDMDTLDIDVGGALSGEEGGGRGAAGDERVPIAVSQKTAADVGDDTPIMIGDFNFTHEEIARMARRYPAMSKLAPDYAVPLLGWLTLELNMSLKEMRNLVMRHPRLLAYRVKSLVEPKTRWLAERLGLGQAQLKKLVLTYPAVLTRSVESNLEPKVKWLEERLGASHDEVGVLVRRFPMILGYSTEKNLEPTIAFFRGDMSGGQEEVKTAILSCPAILSRSLDKRIMPRTSMMRAREIVPIFGSHKWVVTTYTDAQFTRWLDGIRRRGSAVQTVGESGTGPQEGGVGDVGVGSDMMNDVVGGVAAGGVGVGDVSTAEVESGFVSGIAVASGAAGVGNAGGISGSGDAGEQGLDGSRPLKRPNHGRTVLNFREGSGAQDAQGISTGPEDPLVVDSHLERLVVDGGESKQGIERGEMEVPISEIVAS